VLDLLVQLVQCVREVGTQYHEIDNLDHQKADSVETTASILADLDRFKTQCEIGLRATATDSRRAEVHRHAEEAIAHVSTMVEGWRRAYAQAHDREEKRIAQRTVQLEQGMRNALQKFLLPLRDQAGERRLHRVFDGEQYTNTIDAEFVPGLRLRLGLADAGVETPQRIRSLLNERGIKLTIGTKKSGLLRRSEEPNVVTIDDYVILDAEVTPDTARIIFTKKQGVGAEAYTLEMTAVGDGARGRVAKADGPIEPIPDEDRPVLNEIWRALQSEVLRVLGAQARVVGLVLDEEPVDDATMMMKVAERLVETYRPIVTRIAQHSPNPEELTIKIARSDGRREEAYVYRADLAQHLLALPHEARARLSIPELLPEGVDALAVGDYSNMTQATQTGTDSSHLEYDIDVDDASGSPKGEVTEDISLRDIVLDESGVVRFNEDECATQTMVRRSSGTRS
jgi:hypothetical protein